MERPAQNTTPSSSDDDRAQLFLIAAAFVAFGGIGIAWSRVSVWLLEHRVTLPAGSDLVVTLPASGGAGLDLTRLLVGVAAGLLLLALAVSAVAKRRARRAHEEQGQVR
jgi:Flp pilus assembly protein TadB